MEESSTRSEPTGDAMQQDESLRGSPTLQELLAAYHELTKFVDGLTPVIALRRSHGLVGFLTVPAFRPLLQQFLRQHIKGTITLLTRRYYGKAAVLFDPKTGEKERQALEYLDKSLVPPQDRRLLLIFVAIAGLVTALVAALVGAAFPQLAVLLRQTWRHLASLDFVSLQEALSALDGDPGTLSLTEVFAAYLIALLMAVSLYFPISLAVGSFRLKRHFLNRAAMVRFPAPKFVVSETFYSQGGIYRLEEQVLTELGIRTPEEVPIDLLRSSMLPVVVLLVSVPFALDINFWREYMSDFYFYSLQIIETYYDRIAQFGLTDPDAIALYKARLLASFRPIFFIVVVNVAATAVAVSVGVPSVRLLWAVRVWRTRRRRTVFVEPATSSVADRRATSALVASTVGAATLWIPILGMVPSLIAIFLGSKAKNTIDAAVSPGAVFRAQVGLVIGWALLIFAAMSLISVASVYEYFS